MIAGSLFLICLQLSLVAVGGATTVLPELQRQVVDVHGWMGLHSFGALFALGQAAPGPNVLVFTLVGWQVAGPAGAAAATLGVLLPSSLLTWFVGGGLAPVPGAALAAGGAERVGAGNGGDGDGCGGTAGLGDDDGGGGGRADVGGGGGRVADEGASALVVGVGGGFGGFGMGLEGAVAECARGGGWRGRRARKLPPGGLAFG